MGPYLLLLVFLGLFSCLLRCPSFCLLGSIVSGGVFCFLSLVANCLLQFPLFRFPSYFLRFFFWFFTPCCISWGVFSGNFCCFPLWPSVVLFGSACCSLWGVVFLPVCQYMWCWGWLFSVGVAWPHQIVEKLLFAWLAYVFFYICHLQATVSRMVVGSVSRGTSWPLLAMGYPSRPSLALQCIYFIFVFAVLFIPFVCYSWGGAI